MSKFLLAALALGALSAPAFADPVSQISLSPDAQKAFHQKYGERELSEVTGIIRTAIARELANRGTAERANLKVEVVLEDAVPTRPTFKQLGDNPSLDMRSVSIGGAALRARIVDGSGRTVAELNDKWYEYDLDYAGSSSTWGDARYAINRFARKVADAYAANI